MIAKGLLKKIREERGMTVRELAKMVGVSRQAICNYEADRNRPNERRWLKVVRALKLRGNSANSDNYFRRRRISKQSTCECPECEKKAVAKGKCFNHYMRERRKRRKQ